MGAPLVHDAVVAVSLSFDAGQGEPTLAYGYLNASTGATTIIVAEYEPADGAWVPVASHSPQFAQDYDNFSFRVRDGIFYIGLRIQNEGPAGLSSVLRGEGGWDGFEGCWAFKGSVFDFEIDAPPAPGGQGDMRLFSSPTNVTLALRTYNHTGWDNYPATDAFGPPTVLAKDGRLDAVVAARGGGNTLYAAYACSGNVSAVATTLSNSSQVAAVATTFQGDDIDLAWGGDGVLCVSSVEAAGGGAEWQLRVRCRADAVGGDWTDLGVAAAGVLPSAGSSLAVTASGIVYAAALSAANATQAAVASCALPANLTAPLTCAGGWQAVGVTAPGAINYLALAFSGGTNATYIALSATLLPATGEGQSVGAAANASDALVVLTQVDGSPKSAKLPAAPAA
jgi:hypothetical protein